MTMSTGTALCTNFCVVEIFQVVTETEVYHLDVTPIGSLEI